MQLLSVVLLPALGAVLLALASRSRVSPAWASGLVTGTALALLCGLAPKALVGEATVTAWQWIPSLGLELSLRLDGLTLLFGLLILGIGLLVVLYARYYLSGQEGRARFYCLLLLFQSAMLGLVFSENLLLAVVFWELTSLVSFLLIGYSYRKSEARQGARLALLVTGGGGIALLAGVLLLGRMAGSYELSVVLSSRELIQSHPLYGTALVLLLLGIFTKSAQFPFHFWLPHAMAAPTPVSAYLHSATMVKAGIFLLARLFPALAGTEEWFFLVGGAGVTTLVLGAAFALFQHDLKGLLAYSTISHLGLITLLFGLGTPLGEIAALFHLINHAVFKASLFMAAGIIDHEAGTRDMRRLSGLVRKMPYTAMLAIVAAAAMAGVPLLNGFLSKEMFFAETLQVQWMGPWYWLLPTLATLAGVFSVAYSTRFVHDVFFGPPLESLPPERQPPKTPHPPPRWMIVPVEILVVVCLLVGVLPNLTIGTLLEAAAQSVLQAPLPYYSIKLWHGFNTPLLMSVVALLGGVLVYAGRHPLLALYDRHLREFEGKRLVEHGVERTVAAATWITDRLETGSLQRVVLWLVAAALLAPLAGVAAHRAGQPWIGSAGWSDPDLATAMGALGLVIAALAAAAWHRRRLFALLMLGVIGLLVTLAFVRFSAPDLAMTQLLVEVVTLLLLLLAMYFLPADTPRESSPARRGRDVLIATAGGLLAGGATLAILTRPFESISSFYLDQAKPAGGGYNVVNVILVDFRGFDTLGEILVLGIAALGAAALLRGMAVQTRELDWLGRPWASDRHPLMLVVISRPLLPLALLISLYLLLRGHNAPGGGFIAGLVAGVAIVLQYLASGTEWTQARLGRDFRGWIGVGVLLATATGAAALLFSRPFLSSAFRYLEWPLVGKFEVASAMVFDIGVFLTVVATVLIILASLGRLGPADQDPDLELRD